MLATSIACRDGPKEPRWAKGKVHFPPIGAYQAKCRSVGRDAVSVRRASQSIANRSGPLGAHIL
jgi:hypothetical protein